MDARMISNHKRQHSRAVLARPPRPATAYPLLERGYMNGNTTLITAALCVLLGLPSASLAQGGYFGRNKVQYREFDFKVLKTDHFDIYYYPEEEQAAQMASRMAERWYTRLSQLLNHELSGRQPLILYASGSHFRQTNTVSGELGEGTGGVTEAYKRRIVLPFAGPIEASNHVLGHELVHAFQYDITGTNVSSGSAGALAMPLWFIRAWRHCRTVPSIRDRDADARATRREQLPPSIARQPGLLPYRYGQALWALSRADGAPPSEHASSGGRTRRDVRQPSSSSWGRHRRHDRLLPSSRRSGPSPGHEDADAFARPPSRRRRLGDRTSAELSLTASSLDFRATCSRSTCS
jgi:hypothetical protein